MISLALGLAIAAEPGWLLRNVRVVDADGERHVEAIEIRGDRIASVGPPPGDLDGLEVLDLEGATVTPGLIDAHVHLSMTPSGAFLTLDREQELDLWRHHLRAYVACGVTTVLDTGILPEDAAMMRYLATQGPAPDIQILGPLLSPEGGYVGVVLPEFPFATDPATVDALMTAFEPLHPVGVKITLEEGMVTRIWPLYPPAVREAILTEAADRDWPLFAHAISTREYDEALAMGVSGFVHAPARPPRRLVEELARRNLPVISTMAVFDTLLIAPEPERLDLPPVRAVTPRVELDAAVDPDVLEAYVHTVAHTVLPRAPGILRNTAATMFVMPRLLQRRLEGVQRSIKTLHDAGVPIVLGSDSGNWPVFPFEFHGPTTLRELELLGEAGMTNQDAITSGTLRPATLLGLDDEVGRVSEGYRADLIVLNGDPLQSLSVYRTPRFVVRAGVLATPEEWLTR